MFQIFVDTSQGLIDSMFRFIVHAYTNKNLDPVLKTWILYVLDLAKTMNESILLGDLSEKLRTDHICLMAFATIV